MQEDEFTTMRCRAHYRIGCKKEEPCKITVYKPAKWGMQVQCRVIPTRYVPFTTDFMANAIRQGYKV